MSRLLVIEVLDGCVNSVSFDTGEPLDVSVAVVDHNDKRVYRIGEANDGGGEEIIASVKREDCDDGYACDSHNYTDEDDEVDDGEPQGCEHCGNVDHTCVCDGGIGPNLVMEVVK